MAISCPACEIDFVVPENPARERYRPFFVIGVPRRTARLPRRVDTYSEDGELCDGLYGSLLHRVPDSAKPCTQHRRPVSRLHRGGCSGRNVGTRCLLVLHLSCPALHAFLFRSPPRHFSTLVEERAVDLPAPRLGSFGGVGVHLAPRPRNPVRASRRRLHADLGADVRVLRRGRRRVGSPSQATRGARDGSTAILPGAYPAGVSPATVRPLTVDPFSPPSPRDLVHCLTYGTNPTGRHRRWRNGSKARRSRRGSTARACSPASAMSTPPGNRSRGA